jgi:hypothetical protein
MQSAPVIHLLQKLADAASRVFWGFVDSFVDRRDCHFHRLIRWAEQTGSYLCNSTRNKQVNVQSVPPLSRNSDRASTQDGRFTLSAGWCLTSNFRLGDDPPGTHKRASFPLDECIGLKSSGDILRKD